MKHPQVIFACSGIRTRVGAGCSQSASPAWRRGLRLGLVTSGFAFRSFFPARRIYYGSCKLQLIFPVLARFAYVLYCYERFNSFIQCRCIWVVFGICRKQISVKMFNTALVADFPLCVNHVENVLLR